VDIFGKKESTHCGISSCAWGAPKEITEFIQKAGLYSIDYIIDIVRTMDFEGVEIPCEMYIIDKPKLIADLLEGADVATGPVSHQVYDRIIDATGVARAYLTDIWHDQIGQTAQLRVQNCQPDIDKKVFIRLTELGYMWAFPMHDTLHLGCGGIQDKTYRQEYSARVLKESELYRIIGSPSVSCGCTAKVRITGPERAGPHFHTIKGTTIIGVGEAIGAVSPLSGEGNVPGLLTCQLLLDNWENPVGYTARIFQELHWMEEERRLMDLALGGAKIGFAHLDIVLKNAERLGIHITAEKGLEMFTTLAPRFTAKK
jgi:hypothetical protein